MKLPIGYRSRLKQIHADSQIKLNIKQIAEKAGVSRPTIYKWLKGEDVWEKPDWSVVLALSRFYDLKDPNELLEPVYDEESDCMGERAPVG